MPQCLERIWSSCRVEVLHLLILKHWMLSSSYCGRGFRMLGSFVSDLWAVCGVSSYSRDLL